MSTTTSTTIPERASARLRGLGLGLLALALAVACTSPAAVVTPQNVCLQIHEAYSSCGGRWTTCPVSQDAQCPALLDAFSNSYVAAISSCLNSAMPGDCTGACLSPSISGLSPSVAQSKLKSDFCAVCPDGSSTHTPMSCSDFFSENGELIVIFNDSIADQIDATCLPLGDGGGGDCSVAFGNCANAITSKASMAAALGCLSTPDAGLSTPDAAVPDGG